jgi:AraC-like DNA-binding protein
MKRATARAPFERRQSGPHGACRAPATDGTVQRALEAIVADGGTRSIAALDAWHGRSRTRFAAAFRDRVGVSPKRFARIVRFDRALGAIARGNAALGEIALAAGYYDQAHFTSEFREHAGLTPGAYPRAALSPSDQPHRRRGAIFPRHGILTSAKLLP